MARSPACGEVVTARGALRQERRLLETSTGPGRPDHRGVSALLGFERPVVAELPPAAPLADLENCTAANIEFSDRISRGPVEHGYHRAGGTCARPVRSPSR